MTSRSDAPWTIDELGEAVAAALSVGYEGQESGRIRDVPDRRTIRYYTTLGLIDRPAAMRGRTALYGERHLLQLVAIKRLQAEGRSLAEIQAALGGLPPRSLRKLAQLPDGIDAPSPTRSPETGRRAQPFWQAVPEEPVEETPARELERQTAGAASGSDREATIASYAGLQLHGGVTLLFPALRTTSEDDLEAIEHAARPLVRLLQSRGLIEHRTEESRG